MAEDSARAWQRPSIYDVAKHAGVSHMTVSRVLNDTPNIRQSTSERVLQAIDEMNYTRSSIARALATRRAMRIGVLVDSPVQYGPNSTLRAIEAAARSAATRSALSRSRTTRSCRSIRAWSSWSPRESMRCASSRRGRPRCCLRDHAGLPILVIKAESDPEMHTAAVDQRAGAMAAVIHLIEMGHRSIAHLSGSAGLVRRPRPRAGLAGCPVDAGTSDRHALRATGSRTAATHFGRHYDFERITAVFAANDQMALGLVHGLSERGLRVPDDISVVGFDDLPDARHFLPPLTTVRQDFAALGALALRSSSPRSRATKPPSTTSSSRASSCAARPHRRARS